MTNPFTAWAAANQAAAPLYDRAIVLGYNVGASVSGELGQELEMSFWVRRFDLPSGAEQTFTTTTEVSAYLDYLETLPVYCLELENNPRIDMVTTIEPPPHGHASTWITDRQTGEVFGVRSIDLEAVTRLCIHAESQPTIGIGNLAPRMLIHPSPVADEQQRQADQKQSTEDGWQPHRAGQCQEHQQCTDPRHGGGVGKRNPLSEPPGVRGGADAIKEARPKSPQEGRSRPCPGSWRRGLDRRACHHRGPDLPSQ
jgi:hypothetical protein